ncbi:MAG: hypothetical protein SGCHY_001863 [Lobulomycetales sp.]
MSLSTPKKSPSRGLADTPPPVGLVSSVPTSSCRKRKATAASADRYPFSQVSTLMHPMSPSFIPNRPATDDVASHFDMIQELKSPTPRRVRETDAQTIAGNRQYEHVMRTEVFPHLSGGAGDPRDSPVSERNDMRTPKRRTRVHQHFTPPRGSVSDRARHPSVFLDDFSRDAYSSMPISMTAQSILSTPRVQHRSIQKIPYKVLDAPDLQDDFYLNLVDWGESNVLSVGLGSCVYLWAANSSKVTKLCDLAEQDDNVTSVAWNRPGNRLAVGTQRGLVKIYDVAKNEKVVEYKRHDGRVGALSWCNDILTSGSRDRSINCIDPSKPGGVFKKLKHHTQEVCGLKWNPDSSQLASGGNDNKLLVWDRNSYNTPLFHLNEHTAAVKAIAWSPFNGLLASGGGTADKHIRFWNSLTGASLSAHDTGSQVCNLAWSKNSNEIVSTHGYSQNQIVVWKYPSMQQLACLTGHSMRVLYLAMSPDGQNIVTGAGDETLRFWTVFSKGEKSARRMNPLSIR